jgi:tRNA dimethylallyltransferase
MSLSNSNSHILSSKSPLIVIVGETASGKSALAMDLARQFNGEIICADSRTIYKGMDIGTAKPSLGDQAAIPHHLIDVVDPDEPFTVADFQRLALAAMADIEGRGRLPIMVGGTGLYVDAVLYDFSFKARPQHSLRQELELLSVSELQGLLVSRGLGLPNNPQNPRHLIRAIESDGASPAQHELRTNTLVVGVGVGREVLRNRVRARVDTMFESGLRDEVGALVKRYGKQCRALQAIGYQEFFADELAGDLARIKDAIVLHTMQYAKRQRTWFKRNKSIHWTNEQIEIVDLVTTFLNKNT